ncbi:EAL domain-containing protein [Raoultella ornithinolytica]|uniref:EAL domain-containing protein n=1 Tax=Raoultella ornithinolytica TaxID=54291 RepID=UPI003A4D44D8
MRNVILPVFVAVFFILIGVSILNIQLWYSARINSANAAHHAAKRIDAILEEARQATTTSLEVASRGCTPEGQFQLGTEAALKPHLRTILIIKDDKIWCSSLPGNRVLLLNFNDMPDTRLMLIPARNTVNSRPILAWQTRFPAGKAVISISDVHIRDALSSNIQNTQFALVVGDRTIGTAGDVRNTDLSRSTTAYFRSAEFMFAIEYNLPAFFSVKRMINQGAGLLIFILFVACALAWILLKYANKYTTPEDNLRKAIENGEIVPFYQPVVNGRSGAIYGVEVLARWKHPRLGLISPVTFIPLAERTGLIIPLTQSLMAQVVVQMNKITSKLPDGFHIGINFSASHISSPQFMDDCLKYRDGFQNKNLTLVLEVTEREPLHVDEQLIANLNTLHARGFTIALDDFGTGYSGLSYLHDLNIDYIKIDKSFVGRVNGLDESTKLLDCVLEMARKLSLRIVAEGVETVEQLNYLNRKNITLLQGYYFFKPVSYIELIKILLSKNKETVIVE